MKQIISQLIMSKLIIYIIFLLLSLNIIKSMLILRVVKPVNVLIELQVEGKYLQPVDLACKIELTLLSVSLSLRTKQQ